MLALELPSISETSAGIAQAWAGWGQVAIGLAGFALVCYQLVQLKRAVHGDTQSKLYEHYLRVNELLLERPELRPFFYDCTPFDENEFASRRPPGAHREVTQNDIDMMCETILGLLEHATLQRPNLPRGSWRTCWAAYTRVRFEQSPALAGFFLKNKHWYATELCAVVQSQGAFGPTGSAQLCRYRRSHAPWWSVLHVKHLIFHRGGCGGKPNHAPCTIRTGPPGPGGASWPGSKNRPV
jgi:hypothetical protein